MSAITGLMIFHGLRLPCSRYTLTRDLRIYSILNPDAEIHEKITSIEDLALSINRLENGYYMFSDNGYLYIGIRLENHSLIPSIPISIQVPIATNGEINMFHIFCEDNDIDFSTYGIYIISW